MGLFDRLNGIKRPAEGVTPASPEEVRAALLGVNRDDAPYVIRDGAEEDADLVAEWRLDEPAWQVFFIQSQLSRKVRIRMRLDPKDHEVRVLEESWEVTRVGDPPQLKISGEYTRGPDRTVSTRYTITREDDGDLEATQTFRFASSDLRDPLQNAVLKAGWVWRGVLVGKL